MKIDQFTEACSHFTSTSNDIARLDFQLQKDITEIKLGIERMVHWKNKIKYLKIFKDFQSRNMEIEDFASRFYYLFWEQQKEAHNIQVQFKKKSDNSSNLESENFEISRILSEEKYKRANLLLNDLSLNCSCLTLDQEIYQSDIGYLLNEKEFVNRVEPIISELENLFTV